MAKKKPADEEEDNEGLFPLDDIFVFCVFPLPVLIIGKTWKI
jgi:hypothetical protein